MNKFAAKWNHLPVEPYSEAAFSERSSGEWFYEFKKDEFDVE